MFFFYLTPLPAQVYVDPVTRWVATVDDSLQQIVLSWTPSADTQAMGYHICTGTPCLDYDTVFGRQNNTYTCLDHDPLEQHTYRLHVFDSAYNVSSLTPSFGNIVLTADVPPCSSTLSVSWTPYVGMPGGVDRYRLWMMREPVDERYFVAYSTDTAGPLSLEFGIADNITRVWLKVQAVGFPDSVTGGQLVSQSNIIEVKRLTADSAAFVEITSAAYDSASNQVMLSFNIDTSYHTDHYTLWRSIDGRPWSVIAQLPPSVTTSVDGSINPFDSLHCYRLSVTDACDMNEKFSNTQCITVPTPPDPASSIPNVIIIGDPTNGAFLPRLQGLKGDLYEIFIYNRNGILVHHSTDPAAAWIPSTDTPQGAYAYALRCRFNNNIVKIFTGSILVIK